MPESTTVEIGEDCKTFLYGNPRLIYNSRNQGRLQNIAAGIASLGSTTVEIREDCKTRNRGTPQLYLQQQKLGKIAKHYQENFKCHIYNSRNQGRLQNARRSVRVVISTTVEIREDCKTIRQSQLFYRSTTVEIREDCKTYRNHSSILIYNSRNQGRLQNGIKGVRKGLSTTVEIREDCKTISSVSMKIYLQQQKLGKIAKQ